MRFIELRNASRHLWPADAQRRNQQEFPRVVAESPFELWSPGDPIPADDWRFLLGIAPAWNGYDLVLLDVIETQLKIKSRADVRIQLFDTDHCSIEEIERYIPKLKNPVCLPFLGVWHNGQHTESMFGHPARQRVFEILQIPETEFTDAVEEHLRFAEPVSRRSWSAVLRSLFGRLLSVGKRARNEK